MVGGSSSPVSHGMSEAISGTGALTGLAELRRPPRAAPPRRRRGGGEEDADVKAALTKVQLNEADAALVYKTDVKAAAGKVTGIDFPEAAQAINDYPITTLAKAAQPSLAGEFVQLVLSDQGRSVLTEAGFESP